MLCHSWLGPRHAVIGTKTGKVLVLDKAELRSTVSVYDLVQASVSSAAATGADGAANTLQMSVRE